MGKRSFQIEFLGLVDFAFVKADKDLLGTKGLCSPDVRNDLFCDSAAVGDALKGKPIHTVSPNPQNNGNPFTQCIWK